MQDFVGKAQDLQSIANCVCSKKDFNKIWIETFNLKRSVDWFFLFLHPKSEETATCNFDNLESDSRNISLSVTLSTETSYENFIIFINKTHATVSWNVCSNFFIVFLELYSYTLSNCRVGLLSFDGNLFNHDTSSMGCFFEWFIPLRSRILFLIVIVSP